MENSGTAEHREDGVSRSGGIITAVAGKCEVLFDYRVERVLVVPWSSGIISQRAGPILH